MRSSCAIWFTAAAALGAGCASSQPRDVGVRIGDETLDQFEAGTTTEAWVVAILGEPTGWAWVEGVENTKVLHYATDEVTGGLLWGKLRNNVAITYFVVTDGVVTRYWADRSARPAGAAPQGNPVEVDLQHRIRP